MLVLRRGLPSQAIFTQVVGEITTANSSSLACAQAPSGAVSTWTSLLQTASDLLTSISASTQPEIRQERRQEQLIACCTAADSASSSSAATATCKLQLAAGPATAAVVEPGRRPSRRHNLTFAQHGPGHTTRAACSYSTVPEVQQGLPLSYVAPPAVVLSPGGLTSATQRSGFQTLGPSQGLGTQVSQHSIELLVLDAGLSHKQAAKVMSAATTMAVRNGLVNRGLDYDITAHLQWLKQWGVKQLGSVIMSAPGSLLGTPIHRLDEVVQLLRSEAGCDTEDIRTLLERGPKGLTRGLDKLQPLIHLLRTDLLQPQQLAYVLRRYPRLLRYNVETLQRNLEFLREIGVPQSDLARILTKFPQILQLSPEQNLRPTIEYFLQLGLTTDAIPAMLLRSPSIFGTSLIENLQPTIQFLTNEVGVQPERLPHLITASPDLLGRRTEVLRANLARLLLLGIPQEDIAAVVTRFPQLLRLPLQNDNYTAKLDYLRNTLGKDVSVLRTTPTYLGYSLQGRIIPRTEFLQANQRPIPAALSELVTRADAEFCRSVARLPLRAYEAFKAQRQAQQANLLSHKGIAEAAHSGGFHTAC